MDALRPPPIRLVGGSGSAVSGSQFAKIPTVPVPVSSFTIVQAQDPAVIQHLEPPHVTGHRHTFAVAPHAQRAAALGSLSHVEKYARLSPSVPCTPSPAPVVGRRWCRSSTPSTYIVQRQPIEHRRCHTPAARLLSTATGTAPVWMVSCSPGFPS